ncbi:hypothetical protein I0C86_41110 [Plantactinospora sp. S1510]|uniref:DUF5983 domain-containing protein n=1 Tax=Plantactinospora alkalitolerans TaxID=2789879 RepID=A0ABS0HAW4_9ACTN|nr:hypothetical protein [Plantactinospora alkalitolerans]MBF9135252.1 hypothetical protein [Plantactinospora alkalitolerans]
MPTMRVLELANCHLPEEVFDDLLDMDGVHADPITRVHLGGQIGALVYAPEDDEYHVQWYGSMPPELARVLRYARSQGCRYVLFERDAPDDDNLPYWEW